jgi:GWxTD domain-containing protein
MMSGFKKFFLFMTLLLTVFLLLSAGCFLIKAVKPDPFYGTFFEKIRLIMTDEEIEIYKQLPDEQSKEEFIEEFWRIRDPNPGTEENEYKIAFEERIEYANKWFGLRDPFKGREAYDGHDRYRGWDTDRGRIYIILGPPYGLYFDGERILGDRYLARPEAYRIEQWYYYQYNLFVIFTGLSGGKWTVNWNSGLSSCIESAKLNMVDPGYRDDIDRRLKFDAAFKENHIHISIPTKRISFKESGDKLYSEFRIIMNVYLDHKKIDSIEETKSLAKTEEEFLRTKEVIFEIPYEPKLKGKYLFDIIVEDLTAILSSRYRRTIRYKLTNIFLKKIVLAIPQILLFANFKEGYT